MTAKRFSMLLAAYLIENLFGRGDEPLDAETDEAVSLWFTTVYFGQSFGGEESYSRKWTQVATPRGMDYDLRFVE